MDFNEFVADARRVFENYPAVVTAASIHKIVEWWNQNYHLIVFNTGVRCGPITEDCERIVITQCYCLTMTTCMKIEQLLGAQTYRPPAYHNN